MENTIIRGEIIGEQRLVYIDGNLLKPERSQAVWNLSPGFDWGLRASPAAQLALAICLEVLNDDQLAEIVFNQFKVSYVANWRFGRPFEVEINFDDFIRVCDIEEEYI
jgi:hypothetical protein